MNAHTLAIKLGGCRPTGSGFLARCPCHSDKTPSLHISDAPSGLVLFHCFSGCEQLILQRVILPILECDLNFIPRTATFEMKKKSCCSFLPFNLDEPLPVLRHRRLGYPSTFWAYKNIHGQVLFYVRKFFFNSKKHFIPLAREAGTCKTVDRAPAIRPILNLPEVRKHIEASALNWVLLVEGEKCVDNLNSILIDKRFLGTTWSFGSSSVRKTDWSGLTGANVVLIPDADKAGMGAMDKIRELLQPICNQMMMVQVEGMPDGWDVADGVAEGWNEEMLLNWMRPRVKLQLSGVNHALS